ncbi:hypothetical protein Scep_015254 [Stephania cephalantha]|uniref:Uncharacterized protein n=1 Tax=Stephania cephalantha TaxID=152367 RepID=A0AAP0J4S5_9MAGN
MIFFFLSANNVVVAPCHLRAAAGAAPPSSHPRQSSVRLAAAAAAHSRSPLRRSPRWPVAAPRAVVRATGPPLLPTVRSPAGAASAITSSCWRLAKPSPVKPSTVAAVNALPRLAAARESELRHARSSSLLD